MTEHVKRNITPTTFYMELSGDSSETATAPTANIADGSIFVETDTGTVYFFNAESSAWVEQFSFQG